MEMPSLRVSRKKVKLKKTITIEEVEEEAEKVSENEETLEAEMAQMANEDLEEEEITEDVLKLRSHRALMLMMMISQRLQMERPIEESLEEEAEEEAIIEEIEEKEVIEDIEVVTAKEVAEEAEEEPKEESDHLLEEVRRVRPLLKMEMLRTMLLSRLLTKLKLGNEWCATRVSCFILMQ